MMIRFLQISLTMAGIICFGNANAQMQNGGFETGEASLPVWNITGTGDAAYSTTIINKSEEPDNVQEGNYSLQYIVTSPVINDWDIQLRNESVKVKKDSIYIFSFWGKASNDINGDPATVKVQVEDMAVGWPPHYRMGMSEGNDNIPMDKDWKKYSLVYIGLSDFNGLDNIFMYAVRPQSEATYYFDNFEMTEITDLGPTMKTELSETGDQIFLTVPSSITDPSENQDFITVTADGVEIPVVSTDWSDELGRLVITVQLAESIADAKEISLSYDKDGFLQFNFMSPVSFPSFSVNVRTDNTSTGVETVGNSLTQVYPTLVKNSFKIESSDEISAIRILNINGGLIRTIQSNNALVRTINVSDLKSGIYFVQIQTKADSQKVYKVIKE